MNGQKTWGQSGLERHRRLLEFRGSHTDCLAGAQAHRSPSCPRAFAPAVPTGWRPLLPDICRIQSLPCVRAQLKHHLVGEALAGHPSLEQPSPLPPLASFPFWQPSVAEMVLLVCLFTVWLPHPSVSSMHAGPLSPSLSRSQCLEQ